MTVNGSGFIPTSRIRSVAYLFATTYVSSTQLTARLGSEILWQPGTWPIAVQNDFDVVSNTIDFKVVEQQPVSSPISFASPRVIGKITRGASGVFFSYAEERQGSVGRAVTRIRIENDSDQDGSVEFDIRQDPTPLSELPPASIWSLVDLSNGDFAVATVADGGIPNLPFPVTVHRDAEGDFSILRIEGFVARHNIMLARPGVGVWWGIVYPGGRDDLDASQIDGVTHLSIDRFVPIALSPPTPASLSPDDVVISLTSTREAIGGRLAGRFNSTPGAGILSVARGPVSVQESDGVAIVSITRSNGSDPVTVRYTTIEGTAKDGVDYSRVSGTLSFGQGEVVKQVRIPIVNDDAYESTTAFTLEIREPSAGSLGASSVTILVWDDDPLPVVSIDDATVTEGNSGTTDARLTMSLTGRTRAKALLSMSVRIVNSDCCDEDFVAPSLFVVFEPGETAKAFVVKIIGDTRPERDEQILVSVYAHSDSNAVIGDGEGRITIVDDDFPRINVEDATTLEGTGATQMATFLVKLSEPSGKSIAVDYATENATAIGGEDYTPVSGTLVFNPLETVKSVEVPIAGDAVRETTEIFFLTLANAREAVLGRAKGSATIFDDDGGEPALTIESASGGEASGELVFAVRLSAATSSVVEVDYATVDQSARVGEDYVRTAGTLRFVPPTTRLEFRVRILGDDTPEPEEAFFVVLSNVRGAGLQVREAFGIILDDDGVDLETTLTAPNPVSTADLVTLTATISNRASADATGVRWTLSTSPLLRVTRVDGLDGCTVGANVECALARLDAGRRVELRLTATAIGSGSATIEAAVAAAESERIMQNNRATATVKISERTDMVRFTGLSYATHGGQSLLIDVYTPVTAGPFPVILWIPGDDWSAATSRESGLPWRQLARGYAVASVSYRPATSVPFPAQLLDVKAAVAWLKANAARFSIDPQRIGVWGAGAGGHLAALLGTTSDHDAFDVGREYGAISSSVRAVIDWYGPTDFPQIEAQDLFCGAIDHNAPTAPEGRLLGCAIPSCPEQAASASPINYVTSADPPFLIMHGSADCQVPPLQSQTFHAALRAAGVDATLHLLDGLGHGGEEWSRSDVVENVDAFLDAKLKNAPPKTRRRSARP